MKCPLCDSNYIKVIYYGLPHKFCTNENCNCLYGFWSNITKYFQFNGALMIYDKFYLKGLLHWLLIDDKHNR